MNVWRGLIDVTITAKTQRGHTHATAVKAFFLTTMDIHALVCIYACIFNASAAAK